MINTLKVFIILTFLFTLSLPACSSKNDSIVKPNVIGSGTISYPKINEASGIAISRTNKNVLWIINDSGNSPSIFAVNTNGKYLQTFHVNGVKNNDWEDMASFEYEGKPYLLIADVGDNKAKREKCYLHVIKEPIVNSGSQDTPVSVKPEWSITYQYEDGPRDCESVAVDVVNEKIILLSKRDFPPILYEIPLKQQKSTIAKRLGEIKQLPKPKRIEPRQAKYAKYTTQPTSMDISEDGLAIIVQSYASAYYYRDEQNVDWLSLLSTKPKEIILPYLKQSESVCFNEDGTTIFVTSEKLPAPLLKVDLNNQ